MMLYVISRFVEEISTIFVQLNHQSLQPENLILQYHENLIPSKQNNLSYAIHINFNSIFYITVYQQLVVFNFFL